MTLVLTASKLSSSLQNGLQFAKFISFNDVATPEIRTTFMFTDSQSDAYKKRAESEALAVAVGASVETDTRSS